MKSIVRILSIALLVSSAIGFSGVRAAQSDKRVALVVGIGNYPGAAKLKNPANDARHMAAALRKLGFDVIERTDVTQKELNRVIAQFGEKLDVGTTALFFYAGHGMQVRGKNYLIPVDAEINSESAVRTETVDVDVLLDQFATRGSTLNVVILDACRNNPFERKFRSSAGGGLAQIEAPEGTMIAYATAPGKVASDGAGDNGLYTQELLKAMSQSGRPVEQIFKDVRRNVMRATNGDQTPWESSSLTGDFYFALTASQASVAAISVPVRDVETEAWQAVESTTSIAAVQMFVDSYPQSRYASLAKIRLAKMTSEQSAADLSSKPKPASYTPATQTTLDAQRRADVQKKLQDFVNAR